VFERRTCTSVIRDSITSWSRGSLAITSQGWIANLITYGYYGRQVYIFEIILRYLVGVAIAVVQGIGLTSLSLSQA
jgi:hypothetical protein